MRPSRRRCRTYRTARFEPVEPRLFLSADPVADFVLDYFVENQLYHEVYPTLIDAHELTGLDDVRAEYGFTGAGQTVVVIDSGIAYDHAALGGGFGSGYRVVGGFDFSNERDADPYDDGPNGSHGTHVAGIIGSDDPAHPGVAPDVSLVGLRVFGDDGRGYFSWVEEALNWVHLNRNAFENPITTVNLSLGTHWNSDAPPDWAMLEEELAQLEADGLFISVSAGNAFAAQGQPGLSYPAASPYVVPVASVDDDGGLSYFTQRHPRAIAAPGRGVLSTVPDYAGNKNGVQDDFARYSGTSMAAPYVAGAAVLIRQAFEFVGVTDVTQDTIYDLMVNTADTVYDQATGQSYYRLNLGRAIDAVMPDDDFGSSTDTAYDLGTLDASESLSGAIEHLADRDWFTFIAGRTGTVTLTVDASDGFSLQWQLSGDTPGAAATDDVLSFDVIAGKSYAVGLAAEHGLGHYKLDLDLTPSQDNTDWGTVRQERFDGNRLEGDGQWFVFTAAADGILTVEALFDHADGDVDLRLLDADERLLGISNGMTDGERIDVTVSAGDTFYLHAYVYGGGVNEQVDFRVTNLVAQIEDSVWVMGTDADDTFALTAGSTLQMTINDVEYQFDSAEVGHVFFDGRAGSDRAELTGTGGNDVAIICVGAAELRGPGYLAQATNVETYLIHGGGGQDRADFYDSAGNDHFAASLGHAELAGEGFLNRAIGFETVQAHATAGGYDIAKLFDSAGNDRFVATPRFAELSGAGFVSRATGFDSAHAYATAGGYDIAKLFDSRGHDWFVANATQGALYGDGFYNRAKLFEQVHAYATAGGHDVAKLYDSAGDDTFTANPIQGALSGDGFYNRAKHFEAVHAYAVLGGLDTATLYDSAGDDTFVSNPIYGALYGEGFYNRAKYFEQVHAHADAGGHDVAYLTDSAGNDALRAALDWVLLVNDRVSTWASDFEYVHARAVAGGTNTAELVAVDYLLELDGHWD